MLKVFSVFVFLFCAQSLFASSLKIAAGAGYKKPLMEVIKEYEKNGNKVDAFFGNMKQVSTQAKQTDISLIVGDENFLYKRSKLDFKEFISIGEGKVVIAYAKGGKLSSIEDLKNTKKSQCPNLKKLFMELQGKSF